jgi:uncharacterized protein (DUF697 family)
LQASFEFESSERAGLAFEPIAASHLFAIAPIPIKMPQPIDRFFGVELTFYGNAEAD